ncbi:MAG: hypothetical protein IKN04_19335 [Clostridia bacterium]|nr:hypothetical protein [Clostridia bacterium]
MKKLLALLLALVMALGCAGAFAEETQSNEIAVELPSFTVAFESTADVDALMNLLPMFGVDETTMGMMQTILPLLAEVNGQLVFADNGAQIDLGLKGQNVLTIAGEQTEGGFALASDILPSYVLTLSNETIETLMQQFTAQAEDALAGVDMEALIANVTGYAMQFVNTVNGAVATGDPEAGEFVFEDLELTFNTRMPIIVDVEAIKGAMETMIGQFEADESIGSLISALGAMGVPMDMGKQETVVIFPDEVNVYAYTNLDEEGNQVDDTTLVTVETATTAEEVTVNVNVDVLVEGEAVSVFVEMPEQDIAISVYVEPTEEGAAISVVFDGMGITAAETLAISVGDMLTLYCESYLMDMEKPISTETVVFAQGGERTFPVLDENKTVFPVEQLMSDETGEAVQTLLADVMNNGLGNLIAKVSQIMPEEMAGLMNMLTPAEAVEGAAE